MMSQNKWLLLCLAGGLAGCGDGRYEDACAEISQTRVFEGSKRIEILKDVGGLDSQEAVLAHEAYMSLYEFASNYSKVLELAPSVAEKEGFEHCPNLAMELGGTEGCILAIKLARGDSTAEKKAIELTADIEKCGELAGG